MSITIKPREWLLALWANGTFTVEAEDAPCWQRPAPPAMVRAVAALPVEATITALRARVAELEQQLADERKHADELAACLELVGLGPNEPMRGARLRMLDAHTARRAKEAAE